jgi:hypothetical protein
MLSKSINDEDVAKETMRNDLELLKNLVETSVLRKFLAKYTTVLILRIISILIMLTGFWGIASFIMKQL